MQNTTIKDIIRGSFFCISIVVIMHIIPLFSIFGWILLPFPVLFYRLKSGRNQSGIIIAISISILMVATGDFIFNGFYFGSIMMTGFLLGEFIEQHLIIEKIMGYTCLIVVSICFAVIMIFSLSYSGGIQQLISDYIDQYIQLSSQIFSQSNQAYPQLEMDKQLIEKGVKLFIQTFPGLFIVSYLTMMWINILLIKKVLQRKKIIIQTIENLDQYKTFEYLIFAVIGLLVLILLTSGMIKYIAINCLFILMFVYFCQGVAVAAFLFKKKKSPLLLVLFFYVLIAIQPFFLLLVIGSGLLDNWFDFRKLNRKLDVIE